MCIIRAPSQLQLPSLYAMYHSKGGATDSWGTKISLYKDVRSIFTDLKELGIPMAAASRYV